MRDLLDTSMQAGGRGAPFRHPRRGGHRRRPRVGALHAAHARHQVDASPAPSPSLSFPILESIGLLKVDFLGLSTLSVMREAGRLIKERHGIEYNLSNIPFEGEEAARPSRCSPAAR